VNVGDFGNRPLNILIIGGAIPWYPPVGGSAIVPLELAEALGKAGHHVDFLVVTLDNSEMDSKYVHPLYISLPRDSLTYRNKLLLPLHQYLKVFRTLKRYDIVHCEVERAALCALHRTFLGSPPKIVAAVYTGGIPRFFWQRRSLFEAYNFVALKLADLVVCPSDYSRGNVSEAYRIPLPKTRAFHGGVPTHFLEQRPRPQRNGGRFTLVFCGRLNGSREPFKRVDTLLEAMPHVLQRHRAELSIIGTGSRLDEYVALAQTLGIEEEVHFLGHVDHSKLPAHYASADLFVLPSRMENFPLVLLEAMAGGLPVVATRVGGVPEVVDEGVTGLLVRPNDPPALAEAISSLLDDPGRMRSMGEKGRQRVMEHFTWDKVAERMVGYFREIL
jgi:glycosyltransferase involved in cell wall biosynthesis